MTSEWIDAQEFERSWWGDCTNTYQEETKQLDVALKLGLDPLSRDGKWPVYDLEGRSVVDIGGGPVSMLLKTVNHGRVVVVDPGLYPSWVTSRYHAHFITHLRVPAERFRSTEGLFDEAWIYNTLQHVQDPRRVIQNARASARLIRIFEWIDIEQDAGHPHVLDCKSLGRWLGGTGTVEHLPQFPGTAYYGVFETGGKR